MRLIAEQKIRESDETFIIPGREIIRPDGVKLLGPRVHFIILLSGLL